MRLPDRVVVSWENNHVFRAWSERSGTLPPLSSSRKIEYIIQTLTNWINHIDNTVTVWGHRGPHTLRGLSPDAGRLKDPARVSEAKGALDRNQSLPPQQY